MGGRKRRKSSGSKETADIDAVRTRTPSIGTTSISPHNEVFNEESQGGGHRLGAIDAVDHAEEEERPNASRKNSYLGHSRKKDRKKDRKRREKRERKKRPNGDNIIMEGIVDNKPAGEQPEGLQGPRRFDFAVAHTESPSELGQSDHAYKRPFTLRGIPKTLSQNVFTQSAPPALDAAPIPRVRYGIRRTNSLPDHLNQISLARAPSTGVQPVRIGPTTVVTIQETPEEEENISRTTAICLLLISTGLVAICAEFMVDSINAVVSTQSGLNETFIGLIILPIVGNAAEHVTAVTVATKNKMDLAIGVAVGSSIQIGMFPVM
jgi:Ca2+:H+ antiporter